MNNLNVESGAIETTGRYLVLFREDAVAEGVQMLSESTGVRAASPEEFQQQPSSILLRTLGVAVVSAEPEQLRSLRAVSEEESPILAIEPERVVYAISDVLQPLDLTSKASIDYLQGYRDAVNNLVGNLFPGSQNRLLEANIDESVTTWGLQLTKVVNSGASGRGIKVAVLDTGFDFKHPDFLGRTITSKSFIEGEDAQDGHGHGTHCVGTSCGALKPLKLPRYGIAYEAEIFVGKVLSNEGTGTDAGILQAIEWAIASGCDIISMSLGSRTRPGDSYSRVYEAVAQRALKSGTLIIAAAGNESQRAQGIVNPVAHPANCPSIMAVAALDSQLRVADFSDGGINPDGGQVDIAGPGVNIYSSWPMPTQYRTISGTSMATPHVAGIAALHAQVSGLKGQELWSRLTQSARRLPLPSVDVGTGLVQAPE
ncbi:S8 family peptidase [Scytonema sp. PCC 10023]|uniref:S8 family peptidase n=1 Tax=Scytonema sp. PCC 10023 TaxID=1680591 RepID=UPI0039C5C224